MKALLGFSVLAVLCVGAPAQAQYANKSAGISLGGTSFSAKDVDSIWGLVLGLEGSLYIESGWDLGVQVPLMVLFDTKRERQHFTTGLSFNFRYLFMEEYIRPYLGAQLGGIYIFGRNKEQGSFFIDIGPIGGFDYFFSDTWSIGPRLFATFHLMLNEPVRYSIGGALAIHTYF